MISPILYRAVVCTKDVVNITGWEDQAARRLLKKIKKQLGKTPQQLVTIQDFCLVTGIPEEVVLPFLKY
jgi:hypothetical protein